MKLGEDERLDRLLTSLHGIEPGDGFEERIVLAVRRRKMERKPVRAAVWGWAVSGAVACALLVAAGFYRGRLQPAAPVSSVQLPKESKANAEDAKVTPRAQRVVHGRHEVFRVVRVTEPTAHVESFPAPPQPLTEQERLLLRIAHSGDPVELAALNPEIAQGVADKSRSEVQKFFYKPPVIDDKGNYIASADKGDKQ